MENSQIPIPTKVEEITPSWFSQVVKGHVKPETFTLVPNAQEGMGFLSILARVEFVAEFPGENLNRKFNLIVKLIPDANSFLDWARDIVMTEKLDQVEINSYQRYLPDLIQELPQLKKYICDIYFTGIQEENVAKGIPYASVLVMEDLKAQGYGTILYHEKFPEIEFFQGIDFLATLHVASKSLERRKGAKLPEIYPGFPDWLSPKEMSKDCTGAKSLFLGSFPLTCKFLEENSATQLIPDILRVQEKAAAIFDRIMEAGQKSPCGVHADLWSHNILVNKDAAKPIKVIDWQLITYADPICDLVLYTLTTLPIESLNLEGIAKARTGYFKKYEELCLEHKIPLSRNAQEFEEYFNTYGLAYGLICYMISVEPFNNVADGAAAKILHVFKLLSDLKIHDLMLSFV